MCARRSRTPGSNGRAAAGHPVHRRNPSLQPRPAGRPAARGRGRHRHPDRRHDRKPVLRAGGRPAVPLPRHRPRPAVRRRPVGAPGAGREPSRPFLPLSTAARHRLVELADGDGRYLVNMVETLADLPPEPGSTSKPWPRCCNGACRSTTSSRRRTTTSSAPCTNRCAAPIPTPRSTGCAGCSKAARTRATSPAAGPHGERGHRPRRPAGAAAGDRCGRGLRAPGRPRASWRWRSARFIWPPRRSRTPPIWPSEPPRAAPRSTAR